MCCIYFVVVVVGSVSFCFLGKAGATLSTNLSFLLLWQGGCGGIVFPPRGSGRIVFPLRGIWGHAHQKNFVI